MCLPSYFFQISIMRVLASLLVVGAAGTKSQAKNICPDSAAFIHANAQARALVPSFVEAARSTLLVLVCIELF